MSNPLLLQTTYANPAHDGKDPGWAGAICGNKVIADVGSSPPPWEWTPVFDPKDELGNPMTGISGTAILPDISDKDLPFTHPFGFDFEFYIAPDAAFVPLLAPSNLSPSPGLFLDAKNHANQDLHLNTPGVLGIETDQGLVPPLYRPKDGDRVVVFGRWIVDCGHDDFHSEIHPPLLLAVGHQPFLNDGVTPDPDKTVSTLISRPYLVSQAFGDGAIFAHLEAELTKVLTLQSKRVEAHPQVFTTPFQGIVLASYVVSPPSSRRSADDQLLVSFHFTVRTGVALELSNTGSDSVRVTVSMNDAAYVPPKKLPSKHDWNLSVDDLDLLDPEAGPVYRSIMAAQWFLYPDQDPISKSIITGFLAQGILTDRYDAPQAGSPHDGDITTVPVSALSGNTPVTRDDDDAQPFPIYGFLNLTWSRAIERGSTIPVGDWDINANGSKGVLKIDSVDSAGNLTATVFGAKVTGFWDERSQTITFTRIVNAGDPSTTQVYTGYLFSNPGGLFTLAGSFEAFAGTGATSRRVTYGWFAQITIVG